MKTICNSLTLFALVFLLFGCKKEELNKVPAANAGPSQTITLPVSTVTMAGSGTDEDGTIVAYLWSQLSGPDNATIVNNAAANTVIRNLKQGTYVFQLMVTDNGGLTGVDTMSVKVNPSVSQTVILSPSNNPFERMIVNVGGSDQSFSGGNEWVIDAWSVGGSAYVGRKAFKFDFSSIPATATIVSANLYLYSNTPPENGNLVDANFGSSNSMLLQQITTNWTAATTNWNNQPSTTTTNQVVIPHTNLSVLDLNINVTNLVKAMVNSSANYGFMLRLENEVAYNSRQFVSSFHATKVDKHPRIEIVYTP